MSTNCPSVVTADSVAGAHPFGRLPRWCSLPVPGTTVIVSVSSSMRDLVIPIDSKRVYSIGASNRDDITIADMKDVKLVLMHHRSGNVYISSGSSASTTITAYRNDLEVVVISSDPIELQMDSQVDIGGVRLTITRRVGAKLLRDCLRDFCTDDDQTHHNTVRNMTRRGIAQNRDPNTSISSTPASVKRKKKKRKPDEIGDVARSVKFVDL